MPQKEILRPSPQEVVNFCRTCLDFTWQHQRASLENKTCDCVGLIKLVVSNFSLPYSWQGNYDRNPQNDELLQELKQHLVPIKRSEIKDGDILAFKIQNIITHVGFYADDGLYPYPTVIHSDQSVRKVVEVCYSPVYERITHSVYRFHELQQWYNKVSAYEAIV